MAVDFVEGGVADVVDGVFVFEQCDSISGEGRAP